MQTEISNCLRAIVGELADEKIGLAIDNSRIPAQELNELLGSIRSPWLGAAIDTANPLALPQGWQISVRVLGHRTLRAILTDEIIHNTTIVGAPAKSRKGIWRAVVIGEDGGYFVVGRQRVLDGAQGVVHLGHHVGG